ncbi:hypothetical protein F5X97DRAFT_271149 [Nemania serpens]|nr:hypothetical protein F5X97DRAFT_271149 [Nemania serpens]
MKYAVLCTYPVILGMALMCGATYLLYFEQPGVGTRVLIEAIRQSLVFQMRKYMYSSSRYPSSGKKERIGKELPHVDVKPQATCTLGT